MSDSRNASSSSNQPSLSSRSAEALERELVDKALLKKQKHEEQKAKLRRQADAAEIMRQDAKQRKQQGLPVDLFKHDPHGEVKAGNANKDTRPIAASSSQGFMLRVEASASEAKASAAYIGQLLNDDLDNQELAGRETVVSAANSSASSSSSSSSSNSSLQKDVKSNPSSAASNAAAAPVRVANNPAANYALYLLADNSPESLTKAQREIKDGNAILLFPDRTNQSSDAKSLPSYKACIVTGGKLRKLPVSKDKKEAETQEVVMGRRTIVSTQGTLPCDITQSEPNAANLINMALARANISVPPLLTIPANVMQRYLFRDLESDNRSLAALATTSFYAHKLAQPELDQSVQRSVKTVMDLTLRGEISDLHLMSSPAPNTPYRVSDERHLYLYQEKDGRVFYCYTGNQEQQKHYLHDEKQKQPPVDFKSHLFNTTPAYLKYCVDEALRKSVFDITTKRKHTCRSDSEEIRRMVDENQGLPFVVYQPKPGEATTVRNNGGQLISLAGKTPLQVARGENHDYAIDAMTRKLLDVKDEKQKQANGQKIQAQYAAQDAPGSAEEEQVKAKNKKNVLEAQKVLEKAVLESYPGDIQDADHPTYKLTLAKTAGGAAIAAAVTQLEASLEAVRNTVVRTGCHGNPELQLQAREEYDLLLDAGHDWQGAKMQFLFRNLGRYQQMMSLGYTHGFCGDGLYENVDKLQKGQTPRESTSVVVWDSARGAWSGQVGLYSCRGALGVDFALSRWPWGGCVMLAGVVWVGALFKSYVNQKQQAHRPITQQQRDRRPEPPKSSCVVM